MDEHLSSTGIYTIRSKLILLGYVVSCCSVYPFSMKTNPVRLSGILKKNNIAWFLQTYEFDLVSWYLIDFGTRDTLYISIPLGTGDCQWTVCQCRVCGLEAVPDCRGPAPALTHTDRAAGDPAALQGHGPKVHWLCDQGTIWSGKYLGIKIFRLLSSQELHRLWDICSIYNMTFHSTYGIMIMYQDFITYPVKFKTKYYCQ